MRRTIVLVTGLALAACAGEEQAREDTQGSEADRRAEQQAPQDSVGAAESVQPASEAAQSVIEGIVQVVGADPFPQVVLRVGEGAAVTQLALIGGLRDELGRLHGVHVAVSGDREANPQGVPQEAIDVSSYDVVLVNSEPAYLGVLASRNGQWWLDRDDPVRLVALPADLEGRVGAKLWVTGPLEGGELRVQSYGIVREP